jgi:hypothetical protein
MDEYNKLKATGMMQTNFMWLVDIPYIPYVGANNFKILARMTSVPQIRVNQSIVRILDDQYSLPAGKQHDAIWNVEMFVEEGHKLFDQMILWNYYRKLYSTGSMINTVKVDVPIGFKALNNKVISKRMKLIGVMPLGYPEIQGLDQNSAEGILRVNQQFSFDDIDEDPFNLLTFSI